MTLDLIPNPLSTYFLFVLIGGSFTSICGLIYLAIIFKVLNFHLVLSIIIGHQHLTRLVDRISVVAKLGISIQVFAMVFPGVLLVDWLLMFVHDYTCEI